MASPGGGSFIMLMVPLLEDTEINPLTQNRFISLRAYHTPQPLTQGGCGVFIPSSKLQALCAVL